MEQSKEYIDIYAKTVLNDIKSHVRENKIKLSGEQEKKTDNKMLEVIKELCRQGKNASGEYAFKALTPNNEEETKRIMRALILYYTALYNDNVELLNYLLDKEYHFSGGSYYKYPIGLFALDKRISSKFTKELYFELLSKQTKLFNAFYYSLDSKLPNTTLTAEEIINIFCSILNKNPNVAILTDEKPGDNILVYLLTKRTIVYFGEEIILNASEKQKINIISRVYNYYLTDETLKRLKYLMTTYGFASCMPYDAIDMIFEEFTDEELLKIDKLEYDLLDRYCHYDLETEQLELDLEGLREKIYSKPIQVQQTQVQQIQEEPTPKKRFLSFFQRKK